MPNITLLLLILFIFWFYNLGLLVNNLFFNKFYQSDNLFLKLGFNWIMGHVISVWFLYLLAFFNRLEIINISMFVLTNSFILLINIYWLFKKVKIKFNRSLFIDWFWVLAFILFFKTLIGNAAFTPLFAWDSLALWVLKAKTFFYYPGFWGNPFFSQQQFFAYTNQAYPVGFPLLISGYFRITNFVNDQLLQVYLLAFFLNLGFFIFGFLKKNNFLKLSHLSLYLITISFLICPAIIIYSHNGYADLPLATIFVALTIILINFLTSKKNGDFISTFVLLTSFSTLGATFKNEGLSFFFWIGLFSFPFLFRQFRLNKKKFSQLIVWGIFLTLPLTTWFIYKKQIRLPFYLHNNLVAISDLKKLVLINNQYLLELIDTSKYSLSLIPLIIIAIYSASRLLWEKRYLALLPLSILICQLLSYTYIYLITPIPLSLQLTTSFGRLLLQLLPSLLIVTIYQMQQIFSKKND